MAMVVRPKCPTCGPPMVSVCARLGNGPDDKRPTNRKPYKRIGWTCLTCNYIERTELPKEFQMPLL